MKITPELSYKQFVISINPLLISNCYSQDCGLINMCGHFYDQIMCVNMADKAFCQGLFALANMPLQWRHDGRDGVPNDQSHDCLLNRLFRRRSNNTSILRVTGLCAGNSPVTGEFPTQMASYAANVSNWWRHHDNVHAKAFKTSRPSGEVMQDYH